jgi:nitrate reductase NapD
MNYSGILATVAPADTARLAAELAALPGVEVHQTDPASGRIVLVQQADSIDDEAAGFTRIRTLPGVIDAALAYHRFEAAA